MPLLNDTIAAYRRAHELIWGGGLWRFLAIPVLLTICYFPLVFGGALWVAAWSSGQLAEWLPWLRELRGLGRWLIGAVLFAVLAVIGYVTYRSVVMVFYSPFLDSISTRVEIAITGAESGHDLGWAGMLRRVAAMTGCTLVASALLGIAGLFIGLLPLVGWALSALIILPLQLFLSAIGFIDPYLDRNGYSAGASLRLLLREFPRVLVFGGIGALIMLIPLLGWFVGPTYAVVAGVIVGIKMNRHPPAEEAATR